MDEPVYENYIIIVPRFQDAYAYPYVAKLVGPDEKWGLAREFLPRPIKRRCNKDSREFSTDFVSDGIYEIGKKAWDIETKTCFWRERTYVIVAEGDIFPISEQEARRLVQD